MTDKEQRASQCTNYNFETKSCSKSLNGSCCGDIYQIFNLIKQLVRKTQEYEKYKKLAADFKDVNKQLGYKYLTIKQECEELKVAYKKAQDVLARVDKANELKSLTIHKVTKQCEELQKQLKTSEEWRVKAESLNERLDIKSARYRKALEEIEKATKINCEEICGRKFEDCNDTSCFSADILNIINRAKEKNEGQI